jgi:hypothetical protein
MNAQLSTCLFGQDVDVLNDEDNLDKELALLSTARKTLRWWDREDFGTHNWLFFIDDDTWVFTENLERACSQLPTSFPVISTYNCPAFWSFDAATCLSGKTRSMFPGLTDYPQRAKDLFHEKTKYATGYHGGAGLLMNVKASEIIASIMRTDNHMSAAIDATRNSKSLSEGADAMFPFFMGQDHVMRRPLALAIEKSCAEYNVSKSQVYKEVYAPPLQKITKKKNDDGTIIKIVEDAYVSSHPWMHDTHFQKKLGHWKTGAEKCVSDLSPAYPVVPGTRNELDCEKAWELARVHDPTGRKNAHVIESDANLISLHRIKQPKMMYDMEKFKCST